MARSIVALLAALAVVAVAPSAEAQWKWRDKSGHVQYSDLPPPPGTADQDILARPSAPVRRSSVATMQAAAPASGAAAAAPAAAASAASAPRTVDSELEAKRKKAEAEAAAKAKADQERLAAARADNCSRAKGQLATLESGIRLAHTNPKTGEREFLDDKQRADEARRTRDIVASDCK